MTEPTYTGILIDPIAKTVTEIALTDPLLTSLCTAVGCSLLDRVTLDSTPELHDVIVDDEGLYKEDRRFFRILEHAPYNILVGRAVVLAVTPDGDWVSHKLDVEDLKKKVVFLNRTEAMDAARAIEREFMH